MLRIHEQAYLCCCITTQKRDLCADSHAHDDILQKLRINKKMWPCILSSIFLLIFFVMF